MSHNAYYSEWRARWESELLLGESLIALYAADCAPCECVGLDYSTVPCIAVGWHHSMQRHRCLTCGAMWSARKRRGQPYHVLTMGEWDLEVRR